MRLHAALFAVVLACPGLGAAQSAAPPSTPHGPGTPEAAGTSATVASPAPPPWSSDVARIRERLETATPILDAASTRPTFRASVTERADRFDIWSFWGEPDAVAAAVRPRGGTWHHEFQDMVTPDEFKNGAGLSNGARMQLAATSLAFAGAMKLLGAGIEEAKQALHDRAGRKAKEEVQRELEAFYARHPEARPTAATPP